jgi:Ca-activated chloride channel homolog
VSAAAEPRGRLPALVPALVSVLVPAVLLAGSCTGPAASEPLRVLADADLAVLRPLLEDLRAETGARLVVDYLPTLEAGRVLAERDDYDIAWLSTDRYLRLDPSLDDPPRVATMTTAVAVGLRPGASAGLPTDREPTWADLADAAAAGALRFAMADPRHSDSAVAALVGVATAAAGTGGALREQDITCDHLRGFLRGHRLVADTAARTADRFAASGSDVDALVGYEAELAALNASGRLAEPLRIVRPTDGMIQADYPLLLVNLRRQHDFDTVARWLRTENTQRRLVETTWRRPVVPGVPRPRGLPESAGNALYFPDNAEVVATLVDRYVEARGRPPAHTVFVLDFSGSMRGPRNAALRSAFDRLTGAGEPSFVRFHRGERVTVLRFGSTVLEERTVTVTGAADLARLRAVVATDAFAEGTAVWSALDRAYDLAATAAAGTPVAIVLVTDGHNNAGRALPDYLREERPTSVPLLVLATGEADRAALERVATRTGGRLVDSSTAALPRTLEDLRGCV